MQEQIKSILKNHSSGPFLFIGSGFSKRYLGLENWKDLLRKFCEDIKPFEYYYSSANEILPRVATLMADDFHEFFWGEKKYEEMRTEYLNELTSQSSALRIMISDYLSKKIDVVDEYIEEIALFETLNIDGFITTNWDLFLEEIFPDYKVYIGQSELLFSNPQSIGEIYKIHGCITKPNSLILTEEDYHEFDRKNAYLAAKLLTQFVEHPIIFLGYSLNDTNIIKILQSIIQCLDSEQINKLGRNLLFVQWTSEEQETITGSLINIGGTNIPITLIQLNSFVPLYQALQITKHKIPAKILRYCKEQLYELVHSNTANEKLHVVEIDQIENLSEIEFVVGVGVIEERFARTGYQAIEAIDIFQDIVFNDKNLDPTQLIQITLPRLLRRTNYIPIFKYLKLLGICNHDDYLQKGFLLERAYSVNRDFFKIEQYARQFERDYSKISFNEFLSSYSPEKVAIHVPFFSNEQINVELLELYLKENFSYFLKDANNYSTNYKKLICLYDRLKYGWA